MSTSEACDESPGHPGRRARPAVTAPASTRSSMTRSPPATTRCRRRCPTARSPSPRPTASSCTRWWCRAASPTRSSTATARRGDITDSWPRIELLAPLGYTMIIWDYRGFGRSTGTPSESRHPRRRRGACTRRSSSYALRHQARLLRPLVRRRARASISPARHPPAALIEESTFTSVDALVADGADSDLPRDLRRRRLVEQPGEDRDARRGAVPRAARRRRRLRAAEVLGQSSPPPIRARRSWSSCPAPTTRTCPTRWATTTTSPLSTRSCALLLPHQRRDVPGGVGEARQRQPPRGRHQAVVLRRPTARRRR